MYRRTLLMSRSFSMRGKWLANNAGSPVNSQHLFRSTFSASEPEDRRGFGFGQVGVGRCALPTALVLLEPPSLQAYQRRFSAGLRPDGHVTAEQEKGALQRKEADLAAEKARVTKLEAKLAQNKVRAIQTRGIASKLQHEDVLIAELQGLLQKRSRWVQQLTHPPECNKEFLGRQNELKVALNILHLGGHRKEDRCPLFLCSGPLQGQSRFMDEVAKRGLAELGDSKLFVVVLSYKESRGPADCAAENFAARFFCRMLLASVSLYDAESADVFAERYPFLRTLTATDFDRILRQVHGLLHQRIWLLADEFATCLLKAAGGVKASGEISAALDAEVRAIYEFLRWPAVGNKFLFGGFTDSRWELFLPYHYRWTILLPLIGPEGRPQFQVMKSTLLDHYRAAGIPFPTVMYEIVKSCVGMLGFWIELCAKGIYPQDLTSMKAPWLEKLQEKKEVYLGIVERYLRKWGVGSLRRGSFLEEEANKFDSADPGPSILFSPHSNRIASIVAHPVPFYALVCELFRADELESAPLAAQLRQIYDVIFAWNTNSVKATARNEVEAIPGIASNGEGTLPREDDWGPLIEKVAFLVLRMRCHAVALTPQKDPAHLASWLGQWIKDVWADRHPIVLHPDPQLIVTGVDPPRCSLKTLFHGAHKNTRKSIHSLKEQAGQFWSEVSQSGGVLMAPEGNPGFDMVATLSATKEDGSRGIVLVLIEVNSLSDLRLAKDIESRYIGKVIKYSKISLRRNRREVRAEKFGCKVAMEEDEVCGEDKERNFDGETPSALNFGATRKAWLTLRWLNATLSYFRPSGTPVFHVCYVQVTMGKHRPHFETGWTYLVDPNRKTTETLTAAKPKPVKKKNRRQRISLTKVMNDTRKKSVSVSLHAICGQKELENFFTGAVYHALPDAEKGRPNTGEGKKASQSVAKSGGSETAPPPS
jgi:hypothetical protein